MKSPQHAMDLKVYGYLRKLKAKPDLVITDLVMPGISGLGVISLLKQQFPLIPIIAMTGWGKHPSELATEAKADTVLMKPFDLEDLDQSVSKLLTGKTSRKLNLIRSDLSFFLAGHLLLPLSGSPPTKHPDQP